MTDNPIYTAAEIHERYLFARRLDLSGYWLLRDTERAMNVCNGIGAEWFPSWLRWLVNHVCPHIVIVADIHDVRYEIGGTEAQRRNADTEYLANGYAVAEYFYKWYNPMRYLAEWAVRRMHRALRIGGAKAWKEKAKK